MDDLIERGDAIKALYKYSFVSKDIIEREINAIPSADRWIACSERLPEPGSWAIWCSIKGIIQVARWKEDAIDHFFPDQGFFDLEDAVAWMPLPKPYGERKESE